MREVEARMEDRTLVIALSGSIDSANAPRIEQEILQAVTDGSDPDGIVLDCENLEYITSAGLRMILRLKQIKDDTRVINASPAVYDTLDMTGFTTIIDVTKAYRVISVEGCEVVGEGANGKVYRLDPDTIVKVYRHPDSLQDIHRERELARAAFVAGVPTAIPYDVVRIEDGGYGSVFEMLNAQSFAKLLIRREKPLEEIAGMSVDLLKKIHAISLDPHVMPEMRATALDWADFDRDWLPPEQYEKLRSLVAGLPDDQHLLHGDFHVKNIELQDGEAMVIDMDTLSRGHPIFELSAMYNAYCGFTATDPTVVEEFFGIPAETAAEFWRLSLALYLDTKDEERIREVEEKAMAVRYARILRRTVRCGGTETEKGRAVIAHAKRMLADLLPRIDTLQF